MSFDTSLIRVEPAIHKLGYAERSMHRLDSAVKHNPGKTALAAITTGIIGGATWPVSGPTLASAVLFKVCSGAFIMASTGTTLKVMQQWGHFLWGNFGVPLLSYTGYKHRTPEGKPAFTPRVCVEAGINADTLLGKVSYEEIRGKQTPILTLETSDPHKMGFAQGHLMGEQILDLYPRLLDAMLTTISVLMGDFRRSQLKEMADSAHIPDAYRQELEGILEGLKKYCTDRDIPWPGYTIDQLVELHVFADAWKAVGCQNIFGLKSLNAVGCSTIAIKKDGRVWVGSNMDWFSIALMGSHHFIRRYKVKDIERGDMWIESVSVPGFIGVFRAHNDKGLKVVLNEGGKERNFEGIPYPLFTRMMLEKSTTVEEAQRFYSDFHEEHPMWQPSSSHHVTVADETNAKNFQFHMDDEFFTVRDLQPLDERISVLVVTNHFFDGAGTIIDESRACGTSEKRYDTLTEHLSVEKIRELHPEAVIKEGLKKVNRVVTVSSVTFTPEGHMDPCFNNFHAADLHEHTEEDGPRNWNRLEVNSRVERI